MIAKSKTEVSLRNIFKRLYSELLPDRLKSLQVVKRHILLTQ